MKQTRFVLCATAIAAATGLIAAAPASADASAARATPPAPLAAASCVDFLALADNTALGNNFLRDSYQFQSHGAGVVPFVNVFIDLLGNDVHGVQFDDAGIRVAVPAPAAAVDVTVGVFHTPRVRIRAFDASGALVDTASVAADNIVHTVTLDGASDITRLRLTGGGNEAVINEICSS